MKWNRSTFRSKKFNFGSIIETEFSKCHYVIMYSFVAISFDKSDLK